MSLAEEPRHCISDDDNDDDDDGGEEQEGDGRMRRAITPRHHRRRRMGWDQLYQRWYSSPIAILSFPFSYSYKDSW